MLKLRWKTWNLKNRICSLACWQQSLSDAKRFSSLGHLLHQLHLEVCLIHGQKISLLIKRKLFFQLLKILTTPRSQSPLKSGIGFKEFAKEMKVIIIGVSKGSLVITVRCESLMILEELWTNYLSGRLGEVVQNCFVTEKILKELNLAELRLKTTMDIEEYNACKTFFERDARRGW